MKWAEWIRAAEDPARVSEKPEALDDLLVLDVSHANFGAFLAGTFLAELGAEVLKLEPPSGDPARRWGPPDVALDGEGLAYLAEGRNKHYITLNLERPEGRELFRTLAARADAVIDSYPAGHLDALGIGCRQLREANRGLIYAAFSTDGQFGPRAPERRPDYDLVNQALSGMMYVTGEPEDARGPRPEAVPTRMGSWISWYAAGAWGAIAILAALHHRRATGEGQLVDLSGAEALMRFMGLGVFRYEVAGFVREREGLGESAVYPYTFVRVKDGWGFIAGYTDPNFGAICRIMGRPELARDPRFSTTTARTTPENQEPLRREIEAWSIHHTADEILAKVLADPGPGVVVFGRVNAPTETLRESHWWERGAFRRLQDPIYGELLLQAPAWRMTETPPRVKWPCRPLGYHNAHVYQKYLGLGPSRLAELRAQGII